MPKGYIIGHITVNDAEAYKEYVVRDTPILHALGGRFIVRGGQAQVMEGETLSRHVVTSFPATRRRSRPITTPITKRSPISAAAPLIA